MYTESDLRVIAYQLARSGYNVAAAAKALRDEYESFRNISESTIRRMLFKTKFTDLVSELTERVRQQQTQAILEAERARTLKQQEQSSAGQLRAYDRLLNDCVKLFEESLANALKNPERELGPAMRAFDSVVKIVEKMRSQTIPAIADSRQATLLITVFMEETRAMFGPEKAKELSARVRERYIGESEALSAPTEPPVAAG